ncbi:type II toxin-antitoxin system prevent-host-death family antitoxin [Microbacterium sp. KR10-403]|uniref:type II toxin-antitoxin system Phd/YefM family antitoxin n=1 Tax=Microbacterium sp. KR10-403 TaxID=3158581 RepID=UPI0032E4C130
MARVTKTELNQQTAKVLGRVAAGERLTVTDRGVPIAEISPPSPSRWDALVAAGRVRIPTAHGALTLDPEHSPASTRELLADIRGDRS